MFRKLFAELWRDESGAVIATEYLMLGSIVSLGGATGMVAMRDAVGDEYKELGQGVREIRQANTPRPDRPTAARTADYAHTGVQAGQDINFVCPTP